MDLTSDGHVHTKYCGHAIGEMEEYVKAALQKGLKQLVFLEHFEVGVSYFESTWLSPELFETYWQEGMALKEKYLGQLDILLGVEVGFNPACIDLTNDFLASRPWDRVGVSCHFFYHQGRHINMLSRKQANLDEFSRIGIAKVIDEYLENLLVAICHIPADVVCHLDAALRHHGQVCFQPHHIALVEEILHQAVGHNMALEINTSGFPLRGEPFPSLSIIQKAHSLGLAFVVGSDAHRPQDVGRYFDLLPKILGAAACQSH